MGDGDGPLRVFDDKGLGVFQMTLAGGGISIMTDGACTVQALDNVFFENIGDQAHLAMGDERPPVGGYNAARFLAAVLESVQAQVHHIGRLRMAIDSHDGAFFVKFVEHVFDSPI
jgi:hypothetical protein